MEYLVSFLADHKTVLLVAVVVSIIIIVAFIKKLLKIALVVTAVAVLYAAYCIYTGRPSTQPKKGPSRKAVERTSPDHKPGERLFKGLR